MKQKNRNTYESKYNLVIDMIDSGADDEQIACELSISKTTVSSLKSRINRDLD